MKNQPFIRTIVLCSFLLATVQFQSRAEETDIFWRLGSVKENCNNMHSFSIQSNLSILEVEGWVSALIRGVRTVAGLSVNLGVNNFYQVQIQMAGEKDVCDWDPFGTCNPMATKDCVVSNSDIFQLYTILNFGGGGSGGCGGGDGDANTPVTPC
ncbi:hypothetical protein ACFCT7_04695 [Fulvivirgaceae bacterium LMO-SS25]